MKLLGLPDMFRAFADAWTAWKKGKGPAAAEDFENDCQRAQKAQVARDVRYLERALKRKRLLRPVAGGKSKPPAKPPGKPKPR